jgi:hypothetical protein
VSGAPPDADRLEIRESPRRYLIMALLGLGGGIGLYLGGWSLHGIPPTVLLGILVVCSAALAWKGLSASPDPVVIIDAHGIDDRRLHVGPIPWSNVERIYLQIVHSSPILCLVLKDRSVAPAGSRLTRLMGTGDLQIRLVAAIPDHRAVAAFISRLRPDMFSQSLA